MIESVVLIGLAAFVVTFFVKEMDGPLDIFVHFRSMFSADHDELGNPTTFFAKLLECVWCSSTWISFLLLVLYVLFVDNSAFVNNPASALFVWLSSIALAGLIYSVVDRW